MREIEWFDHESVKCPHCHEENGDLFDGIRSIADLSRWLDKKRHTRPWPKRLWSWIWGEK